MRNMMAICFNSENEKLLNKLDLYLKTYNYNDKSELIMIMIFIDRFLSSEMDMNNLLYFLKGFKSFISLYYDDFKNLNLKLNNSSGSIFEAHVKLGIERITPSDRRGQCHYLTELALCEFPELYGAYYYLPKCFKGYAEHSVLANYNQKVVYDLANNIALPLQAFESYYPHPSFVIKGTDFIKLDKIVQNEFGQCLSMYHIDSIIKTKK